MRLYLPSCNRASTTAWLHHSKECLGEKARWELHKDTAYCFEQILEKASYKSAVQPLTSILQTTKVRQAKHAEHCWKSKDELICNVPWTPTHGYTSVSQPAKTYTYQLCTDTWYCQEDLPKAMAGKDGWQERIKESYTVSMPQWYSSP